MNHSSSPDFQASALSLRRAAEVLFRHKALVVTAFLMTALATATVVMLLPSRYEARMKILVKNTRADVVVTPERTEGTRSEAGVTEAQVNSEIELFAGKDSLERIALDCGLVEHTDGRHGREFAPVDIERAVRQLEKDLSIAPIKKANLIEVTYVSRLPDRAAAVLRRAGELYLEKHLRLHRPPGAYEFFRQQAERYESELGGAEADLAGFQRRMNIVSIEEQKQLDLRRASEAETKLVEVQSSLDDTADRIRIVKEQLRTIEPRVVTQSRALPNQYATERLSTMLVELNNKRTELLTKFKADDRRVREYDKMISDTSAALEKAKGQTSTEQATDLNPLRQQLQSELARLEMDEAGLRARGASLAAQAGEVHQKLAQLDGASVAHADLSRGVKTAEENYQLYSRKRDEARIADALDERKITNVAIAEEPRIPALPTRPNRSANLLLGLCFAMFVGVTSAFCAEFFRETVLTPQELERATGVSVLATVPHDRHR